MEENIYECIYSTQEPKNMERNVEEVMTVNLDMDSYLFVKELAQAEHRTIRGQLTVIIQEAKKRHRELFATAHGKQKGHRMEIKA